VKLPSELCPWQFLDDEFLSGFLTDPRNDENAPDRKFVVDYLKESPIKPDFLDVGSGTGNMYLALKESGRLFNYCGLDRTQKMVDFARRRFPEALFTRGDIHKLPYPDRSWSTVYVRHVLTHLSGYVVALSEVMRVCSDCLVLCLLKPLGEKEEIKIVGKPPEQTKPGGFSEHYLNRYRRDPFIRRLEDAGFNLDVDRRIEVGGFFKEYEVIIARRRNGN